MSAFIVACIAGHKDIVELLLNHSDKIDLNAKDNDEWTPWMFACQFGHKDVVQLLLDHSDKIDTSNRPNWLLSKEMRVFIEMHELSKRNKNNL